MREWSVRFADSVTEKSNPIYPVVQRMLKAKIKKIRNITEKLIDADHTFHCIAEYEPTNKLLSGAKECIIQRL